MTDISNIAPNVLETVKDTVTEEAKALGQAAKGQILSQKPKEPAEDKALVKMKKKAKKQQQRLLEQQMTELRRMRETIRTVPLEKTQLPTTQIPQLKREAGQERQIGKQRVEIGPSRRGE